MTKPKEDDMRPKAEADRARDAVLRQMGKMPPKPHKSQSGTPGKS